MALPYLFSFKKGDIEIPSSYDIIHSKENEIIIGEFNVDELLKEESVSEADLTGLGRIKITVYTNEAAGYPHFHIIRNDKEKLSCICIFKARYFVHDAYVLKLNSKQRKQLDKILRMPFKGNPNITNWERIAEVWLTTNDDNGLFASYAKSKQPDYTKLNGYIRN